MIYEDQPDHDIAELLSAGHTDTAEMVHFGNVLNRYMRLCELAGRSY